MDEPENAAVPITETRANPFDAGYRSAWRACNPAPSIGTLVVRGVLYLAILVVLACVLALAPRSR